jgi:hypothetical protein
VSQIVGNVVIIGICFLFCSLERDHRPETFIFYSNCISYIILRKVPYKDIWHAGSLFLMCKVFHLFCLSAYHVGLKHIFKMSGSAQQRALFQVHFFENMTDHHVSFCLFLLIVKLSASLDSV